MFSLETWYVPKQGDRWTGVLKCAQAAARAAGLGEDVSMDVQADAGTAAAEQRREQMLRAALEVIVKRGFAETRIADVAQRAGSSPALVIYYFKTKDQLLTEAIRYSEDMWYADGQQRMAQITTAAGKLEEFVAMSCLPDTEDEAAGSWLLWLDFWAQAARNPEVGSVRQKSDERWRETISSLVLAGQAAGEFRAVNAADFAVCLSALLDGLAIQIALADPAVDAERAFELSMRFSAEQLGFGWTPSPQRLAVVAQARMGNG
jgi:AcrR family transcriptional regulator